MNSTNESELIAAAVEQVFATLATADVTARAESGEWPMRLWDVVRESGFDRALLPESDGGIGASWGTVLPILRGIGQWQVPLPLAETMIARYLAALAQVDVRDDVLTLCEADGSIVLRIEAADEAKPVSTARISGTLVSVPWARQSRAVVVSFPQSAGSRRRVALVELDPAAVTITPRSNTAGESRDTVHFRDADCVIGELPTRFPLTRPVYELGAFARSAMMSGAMSSILEQCVEYAKLRVQFGRPIGTFQAVQQQIALMAGEVCAARTAVDAAANTLPPLADDASRSEIEKCAPFDIAVAKIRSGEAATAVAAIGHAVHGAIGFTREHRLHFATRRLWSWRSEFGTDAQWAAVLGRAAVATGSAGFWPALTARRFGS